MTKAEWMIRIYDPEDYNKTFSYVSSYDSFGNRQLDEIIVFSGIYGVGDYMIWMIHRNIDNYDFGAVNLELELYPHGDNSKPCWRRKYKSVDIKYNPPKGSDVGSYIMFCLSEDTAILREKLVQLGIKSISYNENRLSYQVLQDVLESNNIFKVVYQEHPDKDLVNFEYRQLSFNENWTVEDFINYICDENNYEWFVQNKVLYVSKELKAISEMAISFKTEETDDISESVFFKKYQGSPRPADIMGHWAKTWRCVWAKHSYGKSGGLTKCCFVRRGSGTVDKYLYYSCLEGEIEKSLGTKLLRSNLNSFSIRLGNILKDEGNEKYIDQISIQKNVKDFKVKTPEDSIIEDGKGEIPLVNQKENVSRSTPYLDHNCGILFPVSYLDNKTPNVIIFQVEGREESHIQGSFVMGNGDQNFKILKKNPNDFRMQFPSGWCMYVDEEGNTIIQTNDTDPESIPSGDTNKTFIKLNKDGTIDINTNNKNVTINQGGIAVSLEGHTHGWNSHTHIVNPGALIPGPPTTSNPTTSPQTEGESDKHSKNLRCEQT